ncbi:MAG: hypothetical protein COU68_00480, partial [Candidatus Pacebacteria bacterium CG10_big_fil_rev_8_21_14_0_10_45_6]
MEVQNKQCQNCQLEFTIAPEDFDFYKKIDVPAPTQCPDCRQRRRSAWRNERVLYRRNCDLCGKSTVTIYSQNKPFKVYCPPCWWGDGWETADVGRDFDFNRPFFEQWQELQLSVPRIALLTKNSVNSDYTNHATDNKNCYLCFGLFESENVMYSTNIWDGARDSADCYWLSEGNDLMYECINCSKCYNCQFSMLLRDCTNCLYCYDCRGSSNCFMSVNLRNKQYVFMNEQLTKEGYEQKLKEFNLGSNVERRKLFAQYVEMMRAKALHKFAIIERSTSVSGNEIFNSKNCRNVFEAENAEDSAYCVVCPDVKDCMDAYHFGFNCSLIYESHALVRDNNTFFTHLSYDNAFIQYCDSCHNSENLFGCVGLRKKKYYILNKQYELVQYKELRAKIIEHMKKTGEYGEFFPVQLSPFGYNETQGHIYMPMAKEEAIAKGFKWEDLAPGTFGKGSINMKDLADDIKDIPETITKEA